jgi:putative transcriptional regulator
MKAVFIELPAFERYREQYLDDDAFRRLQEAMMDNPQAGDVIAGTGGLRKMRFGDPRRASGTQGTRERRAHGEEEGMRKKRDLFEELTEGFDALAEHRAGKRTLRTHVVKAKRAPKITARELTRVRRSMNLSRGLFARYLRTNVRTLENWEQGRAKPNAQAALLIRLVQRFPDTMRRLAEI